MAKKEIEIKTWLTREEMAKYLGDLAECLAQGKVVLQRGSEFLELNPAQSMELELEGVQKKGQQKIIIEMSWRQIVIEPVDEPLKISPEAPPALAPDQMPGQEAQITSAQDGTGQQEEPANSKAEQEAKEETGKGRGGRPSSK